MSSDAPDDLTRTASEFDQERPRRLDGRDDSLGMRCGRYVLLDEIGAGGVGVVFRAYDPDLDRKLAIKLMRSSSGRGAKAAERVLREAQAIARLSHPNVTSVYDVGWHNDQVFIAMELASGGSLRTWLKTARSRGEILEMFIAAGEGLEAAHARQLVHRDFKPANVLVDARGTAKVADFGLARLFGGDMRDDDLVSVSPSSPGPEATLTATGAIVGTPAYMAPEQLAGEPVDARADQYSFAVSLCEALTGERRVDAGTDGAAKLDALPLRLRVALNRALSVDPDARFESMRELLAVLRATQRRPRRALGVALGAVALVGIAGVALAATRTDTVEPCSNLGETMRAVWSSKREAAVRKVLEPDARALAAWDVATQGFDEYAKGLHAARVDSCRATFVRKEQSEALLDMRTACLDMRAAELDRLVSLVEAKADLAAANASAVAAYRLSSIDSCSDAAALLRRQARPDDKVLRAHIRALEQGQAGLVARVLVEEWDGIAAMSAEHLGASRTTEYAPLVAGALLISAQVEDEFGRFEAAVARFREAAREAERGGDELLRARAECGLARTLGFALNRNVEAVRASERAQAVLARVPDDDVAAECAMARAVVDKAGGRFDDALEQAEQAVAFQTRASGRSHIKTARARENLGVVLHDRREREAAVTVFREVLALRRELLGPDHPLVGHSLSWLGLALLGVNQFEEGLAELERAVAIVESSGSPLTVASVRMKYGIGLMRNKRLEESLAEHRKVQALLAEHYGEMSPRYADALDNVGAVLTRLERHGEAIRTAERVVEIRRAVSGMDHPITADSTRMLGRRYWAGKQIELAEKTFRTATESHVRRDGDHALMLMPTLLDWGEMMLAEGRWESAREPLEHARRVALAHPDKVPRSDQGWTLLYLGVVESEVGSRAKADELVQAALAIGEELDEAELIKEASALAVKTKR